MTEHLSSDAPVPSITLQITKQHASCFLEASKAISACLEQLQKETSACATGAEHKDLYEDLYQAALKCKNPLIQSFLERMSSSILPLQEVKAGTLLFYEAPKTEKLRHLFRAFGNDSFVLSRQNALSLFRSILTAITCCNHTSEDDANDVVVEGKPEKQEPPLKKVKREEETVSTKQVTEESEEFREACQSPSFDSSLATLRDEDQPPDEAGSVRREIEEVAKFAADKVVHYAQQKGKQVSLQIFNEWYEDKGTSLVPWLELLDVSKWKTSTAPIKQQDVAESPGSLMNEEESSRTLVSFDFSGSGTPTPLCIQISEDNLFALKNLVEATGLMHCPVVEICKRLLQLANRRSVGTETLLTLRRDDFRRSIQNLVSAEDWKHLSQAEKEAFTASLVEVFSCFEESKPSLQPNEVDLQDFAVGFCFFGSGNKSAKLATGFEMLDEKRVGSLSEDNLQRYLGSYLTMLVATSLLVPLSKQKQQRPLTLERRKAIRLAVDNGAKWTLGHYTRHMTESNRKNEYSFESFANWYSTGGYNIAPWLELLDLNKVLSLIDQNDSPIQLPPKAFATTEKRPGPAQRDRVSILRRHHSTRRGPPPEILFTFPLANHRSLIVLKEDATYVRGVVEQLGLLSMTPEDVWSALTKAVGKKQKALKKDQGAIYVNMSIFVQCMQEICPPLGRKRSHPGAAAPVTNASAEELLSNFFQCFDLDQVDRVALDELMGGLSLLCGGKKSTKLAFAFSIFDTRPAVHGKKKKERIVHSLSGEDLFLFLRSILIVTFSTCRQSLDMTDAMVGRCIADTANMICNDVMRHQWDLRQADRLNFDEFGQWYNDGGFERAPWLELLDLKKWVLVDNFDALQKQVAVAPPPVAMPPAAQTPTDMNIPPPPPEDALDPGFFDDTGIMPMDSMDEMDMIFMQPSTDKDDIRSPGAKLSKSFSFSNSPKSRGNPLKFHLVTKEHAGGYMLSLSHKRISQLRRILEKSALHEVSVESACNIILSKASSGSSPKLSREGFHSAMQMIIPKESNDLSVVLLEIFDAFERDGTSKASAIEIACGFTVLCRGKKSDKLEFAFEVLDKKRKGQLNQEYMAKYLRSFLTVLLCIAFSSSLEYDPLDDTITTMNGSRCERSTATVIQAVKAGADWAASMAFQGLEQHKKKGTNGKRKEGKPSMTFDDFAAWYTSEGYSSIPWLELLDLKKWVFTSETG